MHQRVKKFFAEQSGAVAAVVAAVMVVLLGMAAVAFDYGHLSWVSRELHKAAEAGALAGSRSLVPYVGAPLTPNWTAGQNKASQTVISQPESNC